MTRGRILEAAAKAIETGGMSDLTIEALCTGVGITKKAFYYHYTSKDDLVAAAAVELKRRTIDKLTRAMFWTCPNDTAHDRMTNLFTWLEREAKKPEWRGCFAQRLIVELSNMPGHPARQAAVDFCHEFEAVVAGELQRESHVNPQETANVIVTMFCGLTLALLGNRGQGVSVRPIHRMIGTLVPQRTHSSEELVSSF